MTEYPHSRNRNPALFDALVADYVRRGHTPEQADWCAANDVDCYHESVLRAGLKKSPGVTRARTI